MSQTVASILNNRVITFADIDNDFNCAICLQITDEPVRCSGLCAGIFCGICMNQALALSTTCPFCSKTNITAYRDVVLRNQILKHQVYCPNKGVGTDNTTSTTSSKSPSTNSGRGRKRKASPDEQCTWTGRYDELSTHLNVCEWETVTCQNDGCEQQIQRREIGAHEDACIHRNVKCDHCNIVEKAAAMNNHRAVCPKMMITCECGFQYLRKRQTAHRDNDCLMTEIECEVVGCGAKMKRIDYGKHQAESAQNHVRLLSTVVQKLTGNVFKLAGNVLSLSKLSESHSKQVKWTVTDIAAKSRETAVDKKQYLSPKFDVYFRGNHKLYIQAEIEGNKLGLYLCKDVAMSDDNFRLRVGGTSFTVTKAGLPNKNMTFPPDDFLGLTAWGKGFLSFLEDMTPYIDNDGINVTVDIKLSKEVDDEVITL